MNPYLGLLTYSADLSAAPRIADVERIADAMVLGMVYLDRVQIYSDALDAAIADPEPLARFDQDEASLRAYLHLLRQALDARRPWPAPTFIVVAVQHFPGVRSEVPLLHLPDISIEDLQARLATSAVRVAPELDAIVLKLLPGPCVALTGAPLPVCRVSTCVP